MQGSRRRPSHHPPEEAGLSREGRGGSLRREGSTRSRRSHESPTPSRAHSPRPSTVSDQLPYPAPSLPSKQSVDLAYGLRRPPIYVHPPVSRPVPAAEGRLLVAWLLVGLAVTLVLVFFSGIRLGGLFGSEAGFQLQVWPLGPLFSTAGHRL